MPGEPAWVGDSTNGAQILERMRLYAFQAGLVPSTPTYPRSIFAYRQVMSAAYAETC